MISRSPALTTHANTSNKIPRNEKKTAGNIFTFTFFRIPSERQPCHYANVYVETQWANARARAEDKPSGVDLLQLTPTEEQTGLTLKPYLHHEAREVFSNM